MGATSGTRRGNGAGWGGDAKGAGTGGQAAPFAAGNETRVSAAEYNFEPDAQAYRTERRRIQSARREKAWSVIDEIMDDVADKRRLDAAVAALNRIDGMPVATNVNLSADDVGTLSDDELRSELARISGTGGPTIEGIDAEAVQAGPPDVLHPRNQASGPYTGIAPSTPNP